MSARRESQVTPAIGAIEIEPLQATLERPPRVADAPDRRWLLPREAAALGLPAPVRKLIASLSEES